MYTRVSDFLEDWAQESASTLKMFEAVTDGALGVAASGADRALGSVAWHIVTSMPEMLGRTGLAVESVGADAGRPSTAGEIAAAYRRAAGEVAEAVLGELDGRDAGGGGRHVRDEMAAGDDVAGAGAA